MNTTIQLSKKQTKMVEECINSNYYPFYDATGETCTVKPMSDFACKKVMDEYDRLVKPQIGMNMCYSNALIAAAFFKSKGICVEIVEGRYSIKENLEEIMSQYLIDEVNRKYEEKFSSLTEEVRKERSKLQSENNTHRWLKKGDYYFDPTLDKFGLQEYTDLHPERVYDVETIIAYTQMLEGHTVSSIDGCSFDEDNNPIHHSYINDDFQLCAA